MRKALRFIVTSIDYISRMSGQILSYLLFLMIFIVLYEVIARYLFNSPTSWSLEAATMIFGTYMVGGGAFAVLSKAHVNMDIFYSKWSERSKAIVDTCTFPIISFYFSMMCWQAVSYGIESFSIHEHASSVWGPSLYQWKIVVAIGLILLWLQIVSDFLKNLTLAITGEKLL